MAGISNSSSHRGEEKALPQFRQGKGPVTSCMHACSGCDRHVIPLGVQFLKCGCLTLKEEKDQQPAKLSSSWNLLTITTIRVGAVTWCSSVEDKSIADSTNNQGRAPIVHFAIVRYSFKQMMICLDPVPG